MNRAFQGWLSANSSTINLATGLVLLAGIVYYATMQMHHDVAWYVYCNLQQLEGKRLYVDFIEINPPISFYLTMIPVLVSKATGLPVNISLSAFVFLLTALVLRLISLFDQSNDEHGRQVKRLACAIILTIAPLCVFAQREHFAVLLGLPYLYLAGARLKGTPVSVRTAILIGVMAGIGFSIKHYFLLTPLLVEALLIYRQRSFRSLLRAEMYAAIAIGLLHASLVIAVYPEYFTKVLPLVFGAYSAYSRPLWAIAMQPWNLAVLLGVVFWLLARARITGPATADALFAATVAFSLCVILQQKGWTYHTLPAAITLAISSVELIAAANSGGTQTVLRGRQRLTVPAAPIILILMQVLLVGPYRNALAIDAAPFVRKYAPNEAIFVMSSNLSAGFPMTLDTNAIWASRFATLWLPPMIVRSRADPTASTQAQLQKIDSLHRLDLDAVVEDFQKFKPKLVFVDHFYEQYSTALYGGLSVNLLDYYLHDPRFADIWEEYQLVGTLPARPPDNERTLDVWVRKSGN